MNKSTLQNRKKQQKQKLLDCLCVDVEKLLFAKNSVLKKPLYIRSIYRDEKPYQQFSKKVVLSLNFCWNYQQFLIKSRTFVVLKLYFVGGDC